MAKMTEKHWARLRYLEEEDRLTPDHVLEDAKNPASPLHELFDWDVDRAARLAWLTQARHIIRTYQVVVTVRKKTIVIPNYVRDPDREPREQGYVSIRAVQEDEWLARRVLIDECGRISGAVARARGIAAACGMEKEFEDLLRRVVGLRTRLEQEVEKGAPEYAKTRTEPAAPSA